MGLSVYLQVELRIACIFAVLFDEFLEAVDIGFIHIRLVCQVHHQRDWIATKQSIDEVSNATLDNFLGLSGR